jgi:hypothetical protein
MMPRTWIAHALAAYTLVGLAVSFFIPEDPITAARLAEASGAPGESGESGGTLVGLIAITVFLLAALTTGWLIAWKRPENSLGWIMLVIPALFASHPILVLVGYAWIPVNETLAAWVLLVGGANGEANMSWLPPIGLLMTQVPLRFPTGRLPSPRWRWWSWFTIVWIVVATVVGSTLPEVSALGVGYGIDSPLAFIDWGENTGIVSAVLFGVLGVAFFGSLASLFVRYRGADAQERTQLRWMFWGCAVPITLLVISWVLSSALSAQSWAGEIDVTAFVAFSYSFIPLSILFAVLRLGLYSIDRIISRTISYALVLLAIVAIYTAIVIGIGALFDGANQVLVAIATLIAAAVFLPLLRWLQRILDRRFDRARYDAEAVVERFGSRIQTQVDPDATVPELVGAVERALQPTIVGVWTRGDRA